MSVHWMTGREPHEGSFSPGRISAPVAALLGVLALSVGGCKEVGEAPERGSAAKTSQGGGAAAKPGIQPPSLPKEAVREFVSALASRDYTKARGYLATGEVYCKEMTDDQLPGCLGFFDLLPPQLESFAKQKVPEGFTVDKIVLSDRGAINSPGATYLRNASVYEVSGKTDSGEAKVVVQVVKIKNGYGIAFPAFRKK